MKKYLIIPFIGFISFGLNGQFYINKNAEVTLEGNVVVTSNEEIINNGKVLGRGKILLLERLENNGVFDVNSLNIGRNKSYIGGRRQINLNKLLISSDVFLNTDLALRDTLDFNNSGRIFTNENKVVFEEAANYYNLTDETYIAGKIRKFGYPGFIFPLGTQNRLRPIFIESNDNKYSSLDIGIANFASLDEFKNVDSEKTADYFYTLTKPKFDLIRDISIKDIETLGSNQSIFLNEENSWTNKIALNRDQNIIITKGNINESFIFKNNELDVNVFPNPSNGKINITSSHKIFNLKVYDEIGRVELDLSNILNQSQVILPEKLVNKPIILQFESQGKFKVIKHIYTNQLISHEK